MKELVRYLLDNLQIDFQGDITLAQVQELLQKDSSPEARTLLTKLNQDGAVDDFLLTLADVLGPIVRTGIPEQVMRDQIAEYAES